MLFTTFFLTTGCSQIQGLAADLTGEDDKTLAMLTQPAGEPLWSVAIRPAGSSGPLIIDETVVSYVVEDGELKLAGFSLASGEKVWDFHAATGASTHLPIEAFTGNDGTDYVVYRSTPEFDVPTNYWRHPITVIEADTGSVKVTSSPEWWTAPVSPECAGIEMVCMAGMQPDSPLETIAIDENGVFNVNPLSSRFPQLHSVHDAYPGDDFVTGVGKDGANVGVYVQDDEPAWDIPLADLGLPATLDSNESGLYWPEATAVAQKFPDDQVVLIDATYRDLSTDLVIQEATVTALDMNSGEILWATPGELCLHGIVCEGENSFIQEDGSRSYQPGDFTLARHDLRTGEREWENTLEAMTMYPEISWEVVGDEYGVLSLEDSNKLMHLSSGELLDIADEQRFGCWTEGPTFTHHRSSRPDLPLVEDTNNVVSQSCGESGVAGDLTSFTQNVVASRSNKPFAAGDDWNAFEKQVRVIATTDGIHAYEF